MPSNKRRVILKENGRKFLKELRLSNDLPTEFKKKYSTIIKWESGKSNPTFCLLEEYLLKRYSFKKNLRI